MDDIFRAVLVQNIYLRLSGISCAFIAFLLFLSGTRGDLWQIRV
jgi:hypothetical protein